MAKRTGHKQHEHKHHAEHKHKGNEHKGHEHKHHGHHKDKAQDKAGKDMNMHDKANAYDFIKKQGVDASNVATIKAMYDALGKEKITTAQEIHKLSTEAHDMEVLMNLPADTVKQLMHAAHLHAESHSIVAPSIMHEIDHFITAPHSGTYQGNTITNADLVTAVTTEGWHSIDS
jgi:hypothetical protein